MRIKRIKQEPPPPPPTHLLAVTELEMKALRRASEAYVQDEHRERSFFYKDTLRGIVVELERALQENASIRALA